MKWEKLMKDYPNLYRHHDHICFEVGPGWYNLIRDLSAKLETLIEDQPDTKKINSMSEKEQKSLYVPAFYATQVKEKYGTLRFYMSLQTEEMANLIEEAEELSEITCEDCGNPGILHTTGWWSVTCTGCDYLRNQKKS